MDEPEALINSDQAKTDQANCQVSNALDIYLSKTTRTDIKFIDSKAIAKLILERTEQIKD